MLTEKLNAEERQEWTKQLTVIELGKKHFWATVEALSIIRKDRLFREEFSTWEAFVTVRLGMTKRYADMLILGSSALTILGTIVPETVVRKIATPWKLRNLSGLTTEKMAEVVNHADGCSGGGEISGSMIVASRKIVMGEVGADDGAEASDAMQTFKRALSEIDSVDAVLLCLELLGSVEDQALILSEIAPALVAAIKA